MANKKRVKLFTIYSIVVSFDHLLYQTVGEAWPSLFIYMTNRTGVSPGEIGREPREILFFLKGGNRGK